MSFHNDEFHQTPSEYRELVKAIDRIGKALEDVAIAIENASGGDQVDMSEVALELSEIAKALNNK